mmetsp:Transcript_23201/g.69678  ORF Transcript_23201/g.69678 Transcript_23201/m.69678 type:complete len:95 (-) Transcript_23201:81-365(-)
MGYDAIDRRCLFDRFDTNGDGYIDGSELVSGLMAASLGKLDKDGATAAAVRSVLVKVAAIEKAVKAKPRIEASTSGGMRPSYDFETGHSSKIPV